MFVLLFDIDGTLIHTRGAGQRALDRALAELFGKTWHDGVTVHGCTDRGIVQELFRALEIIDSEDNWQRLIDGYVRYLPETLTSSQGTILEGVERLLAELHMRSDVLLGLLTGNTSRSAQLKLQHFGIDQYFQFGAFGDLHARRDDLARHALLEIHRHIGGPIDAERVWVIEARVAAVTTGAYDESVLAPLAPDLLLKTLADPSPLVERLVSH